MLHNRSIFENLTGHPPGGRGRVRAVEHRFIVYHDDYGDYSTNELIMDGTVNLIHLLAGYGGG